MHSRRIPLHNPSATSSLPSPHCLSYLPPNSFLEASAAAASRTRGGAAADLEAADVLRLGWGVLAAVVARADLQDDRPYVLCRQRVTAVLTDDRLQWQAASVFCVRRLLCFGGMGRMLNCAVRGRSIAGLPPSRPGTTSCAARNGASPRRHKAQPAHPQPPLSSCPAVCCAGAAPYTRKGHGGSPAEVRHRHCLTPVFSLPFCQSLMPFLAVLQGASHLDAHAVQNLVGKEVEGPTVVPETVALFLPKFRRHLRRLPGALVLLHCVQPNGREEPEDLVGPDTVSMLAPSLLSY